MKTEQLIQYLVRNFKIRNLFTAINNKAAAPAARSYLAAISTNTGKATSWKADANSYVYALAAKDVTLYAGGDFTTIKGSSRNYGAGLATSNAAVNSWAPNTNSSN